MWFEIGVGVAAVVVAIAAWLWPRNGPKAGVHQRQDVGSIDHPTGHVIQAGRDVIIHPPAPQAPAVAGARPIQPTADISVDELSRRLSAANDFRKKDILRHYSTKTFHILGDIENVESSESPNPSLFVRQDDVIVYVKFKGLKNGHFDYIRDEGWRLDCIASLHELQLGSIVAFRDPEWYEVKLK